jgi:toxin YoeB
MKRIVFDFKAFEDFNEWARVDKKIQNKIVELIKDINRNSHYGLGKPELLKHELSGYWSRRINDEHRLIYKITNEEIIVISCKYHYK